MLAYYKKLIALRKNEEFKETLVYGDFEPLMEGEHNVIAYLRRGERQTILVAANFNKEERTVMLPESFSGCGGRLLLSNGGEPVTEGGTVRLEGLQAAVILMKREAQI